MTLSLVTGSTGFIGGHLVEALVAQGERVRCFARQTSDTRLLEKLGVEIVHGDVTEFPPLQRAMAGVDTVYNVAGLRSAVRKTELARVNKGGVDNVARACAEQKIPPVHVFVSSIAASGPARRGHVRREDETPAPVSIYGRSKLAGEHAARKWAHLVPTTIVRPGIVFGPRNVECLPVFQSIHRLAVHAVVGFRSPRVSLIHVEDLVQVLIRAAKKGRRVLPDSNCGPAISERGHGCYFACAGEQPDYAEFGRMIGQALGRRRVLVFRFIAPFCWIFGSAGDLLQNVRRKPLSLSIDKVREGKAPSWGCSTESLRRDLEFEEACNLSDRIQDTVDWYYRNGWLREPSRRSR